MIDARINRWEGYKLYHVSAMKVGDCDPQYPALRYVADRAGFDLEQRLWLAFLFAFSYCAPTALYMLSEFPDYEKVDLRKMEAWWQANKKKALFQTDRTWVKNLGKVIPCFASYRALVGENQADTWRKLIVPGDEKKTYQRAFQHMGDLYYFGRFGLFLLLEAVQRLTGFPMKPDILELKEAESCRDGVCYVIGHDDWVRRRVPKEGWPVLQDAVQRLETELTAEWPELPIDLWYIETSLCAWKKLFWRTRYFGYYIDRQQEEIICMQRRFPGVIYWEMLWDFRKEFIRPDFRGEASGWAGIRKEQMNTFANTGRIGNGMEHLAKYRPFVPAQYEWWGE